MDKVQKPRDSGEQHSVEARRMPVARLCRPAGHVERHRLYDTGLCAQQTGLLPEDSWFTSVFKVGAWRLHLLYYATRCTGWSHSRRYFLHYRVATKVSRVVPCIACRLLTLMVCMVKSYPRNRRWRIPHCLDNRLIDGDKVVSLTHRPRSTPQIHYISASGTHFC
jgi:hypothetical protein